MKKKLILLGTVGLALSALASASLATSVMHVGNPTPSASIKSNAKLGYNESTGLVIRNCTYDSYDFNTSEPTGQTHSGTLTSKSDYPYNIRTINNVSWPIHVHISNGAFDGDMLPTGAEYRYLDIGDCGSSNNSAKALSKTDAKPVVHLH